MQKQSLSATAQVQIKKAVGLGLKKYLDLSTNERQKLEQQGIKLDTFIFENIVPIILNVKMKNILIVMEQGIGNMVMLTPVLRLLRHNNPRLNITVLGNEKALEVINGWDVIDNCITEFDDNYYDLVVYTIWSSGVKSQQGDYIAQYCKASVDIDFKDVHESILQLAPSDFLDGGSELVESHCQIEEVEVPKDYIVFGDTTIHLPTWSKKKYPYYVELAKLIDKKFPELTIYLIGDEEDKKQAEEKKWPKNVKLSYMGNLTIPKLAYFIKHAKFYVGNDTGPTHIAASVGTKTYVHFGPTKINKNKPLGKDVHVLSKNIPCAPCQYTEQWENCEYDNCLNFFSAQETYNEIFYPEKKKKKALLVGDFSQGILRNERNIKEILKKDYNIKVHQLDFNAEINKYKNSVEATYSIVNKVMTMEPELLLICDGQNILPDILSYINNLLPKCHIAIWRKGNTGGIEQWFHSISAVCDSSYWNTGDPNMISQVFAQTYKPCEYLISTPDSESYYPTTQEKDIDVLYIGDISKQEQLQWLEYIDKNLSNKINFQIYSNSKIEGQIKYKIKPEIFEDELNKILNRAKIVINYSDISNISFYFPDSYIYPMAVKTVGLNKKVPKLEEMFEDNKQMVFFDTNEECVNNINKLLEDDSLRNTIGEEGYKLYKEKYTLKEMVGRIVDNV